MREGDQSAESDQPDFSVRLQLRKRGGPAFQSGPSGGRRNAAQPTSDARRPGVGSAPRGGQAPVKAARPDSDTTSR
eukprot:646593-Pyramimonas_sp.AAC.1